jgi:23S rRNA pseudouridine2457 synthase
MPASTYIILNKPYGVLTKFTGGPGEVTLRSCGPFPPRVYPVGRLDADSEGLLLLTDDPRVAHRLTEPAFAHPRTYLAQVERIPTDEALAELREGVIVKGRRSRNAAVRLLEAEPDLPPRPVPIRFRKNVPTAWLEITLTEGRNRQVRRMTAAVGHPTLRLVRTAIGVLHLKTLRPGESRRLAPAEVNVLLRSIGL